MASQTKPTRQTYYIFPPKQLIANNWRRPGNERSL